MRRSHGVDGTGVGIGVLSSGVATLMTGAAAADLRDRVTVLPGQAGEGDDGTATLSILHDLAPGGELYFATGLGGPARFAANLEALCRTGADVIVDDLFDYQETIYQGGLMAQAVKAAVRNGCVYVSAKGNPVKSRVWGAETAPDQWPPMADDLSTTGDSAGPNADLSGATCVTTANPDFATFCVSSAPPPQVAARVALILESAGGFHNTSLEELRAAVTGGGLEPEPMPLNVATGPAVHKIEINSNPPEGRETYGIGDAIEVTVTFSEVVNVTGTPQLGLRVGRLTRSASYAGGTGTTALVFSYTVAEDDEDTDGLRVEADSLSVELGVIEDGSDHAAELNHAGLPDQAGQRVDGVNPSLVDSDEVGVRGSTLTELMGPSSSDYAENGANRVATYSASSPEDNGDITWLLLGTDSDDFSIDGGVLRFRALPDFESPSDADTNNIYSATVAASDGSTTVTKDVTVTVTNVDEPGTLTLSPTRPRIGTALTAAVTDPDGVTGTTTWTWERSAGRNEWNVIGGVALSSYPPVAADAGHYLRATATYTDQHGTDRTARAVAPHVVLAHRLSRLEISGHEPSRPMYPAFDPDTLHYGVGCGDGALSLTMSTEEASTRLAVNGIQRTSQNSVVTLSGLNGQDEESDIRITLSDSAGASTTYVVHCVSSDAPVITTTARAGATEDLVLFSTRDHDIAGSYLLIIDNNGVPRFRRSIPEGASHFRTHQDGKSPYSYATPWGSVPNFRGDIATSSQFVMLDNDFEPARTVRNIAPVTHATGHDFLIKEDGGYALLSYNPVRRDLSAFNDDQGNPYSTAEGTEDSIIQEVGANGQESFRWNSWNHMAIEDCTQHRFPWDYAHINTIEDLDGDYLASLRGCSQVVRIDGETGEVIWRLGRSNRSDEDWVAGAGTPPVPIMDDPYGEFCGQHSGTLLKNGNLVVFDNGDHCVVDPATGESQREGGVFSRIVEYSLDRDSGTGQLVGAIFQRHHSLHSEFNRFARSQGHVEPMPNGHWLISWGRGTFDDDPNTPLPPDEAITQVNPLTGEEVLSVIVKPPDEDFLIPVRAYLLSPVALADTLGPLTAEIVESPANSVFHIGPTDAPQVVVAISRPVVDFTAATPSFRLTGATLDSVSALVPRNT